MHTPFLDTLGVGERPGKVQEAAEETKQHQNCCACPQHMCFGTPENR